MALPHETTGAIPERVDVAALKQTHPIEDVVGRYGIELKRQGRALVGRCPFHADGGRPNLHIFTATQTWWCFRCCLGGDVLKFVMLVEDIGFREAADRLSGGACGSVRAAPKQLTRPGRAAHESDRPGNNVRPHPFPDLHIKVGELLLGDADVVPVDAVRMRQVHAGNAFVWATQHTLDPVPSWVVFCAPPYAFYLDRRRSEPCPTRRRAHGSQR